MRNIIVILFVLSFFCGCSSVEKKNDTEVNELDQNAHNETSRPTDDQSPEEVDHIPDTNLATTQEVDYYICYIDDNQPKRVIWISFEKQGKALQVKYKGQKSAIDLVFDTEETQNGGAYPTIETYYNEIYNGEVNGTYKLTHAGIWDYVVYTRGRDGKRFDFTIDHDADPYGKVPCF